MDSLNKKALDYDYTEYIFDIGLCGAPGIVL